MTCKNCGAELEQGAVFCASCGAKVTPETEPLAAEETVAAAQPPANEEAAPQPEVAAPPQPQPVVQPEPAVQQQAPVYQPPVNPQPQLAYGAAPAPKKKGSALKIVGIIACVIVVLAVVIFAGRNLFVKAAVGEVNYYLYSEINTVGEILDDKDFAALLGTKEATFDADGSIEVDGESVEANMKGAFSQNKDKATFEFSGKGAGADMGTVTVNYGDGKLGIKSGESEVTIPLELGKASKSDYAKLIKRVYPIIKNVEKDNRDKITKSHEKIDGKRCRVVTVELTESELNNIMADIIEAVAEDDKLLDEVKQIALDNAALMAEYLGEDEDIEDTIDEAFDNFADSADEYVQSLRDTAEEMEKSDHEDTYTYKVAYKNGKTVYQREFTVSTYTWGTSEDGEDTFTPDEYTYTITTDVGKKSAEITLEEDGEEILTCTKEKSGKYIELNIEGNIDGDTFKISSDNLGVDKVNGVAVPVGTIEFVADEVSGTIEMEAGDNFTVNATAKYDGEETFKLSLDAELDKKADLSDYEEPDEDAKGSIDSMFGDIFGMGGGSDYDDYDYGDYDYGDYYG